MAASSPIVRRRASSRWMLWAFALALLLKGAMPMLASASAHAQGKAVAEVCTVYGVALVALDAQDDPAPADHPAAGHAADHCALLALAALSVPAHAALAVPAAAPLAQAAPPAHPSFQAPDACATWVARLKHGPPSLA
jgi:hypothetical protein